MQPCPRCGSPDWKEVSETKQFTYKACGNCNYSPWLEKAESLDAKTWFGEVIERCEVARREYQEAEAAYRAKETTLTMGKANRAKRQLEAAERRVQIAEAMSVIVEMMESGQVTLLLPELGLFQFEWGDFKLFSGIGKTT